ncbi:ABC transporter ATP-binding protein [Aureibacillus halotolerans]|uniref:ABC-2 type transport system ATP-binding protein n=1 Tax=Aureibacillus halotolerans TaxID=1508390 RepID=A0A4R6U3U1_9BACI|nr:ABC transporter ATP-binding protein [Aureibacillus halotolerans]TDQ40346.1 ABC-2 type transport system ATP-binding protein [Aureibacillus halotolerans]
MIKTVNLTKTYGTFTALKELNLEVQKGTVFGFVGQNGAGKSTTFSILSTLLTPTSGEARVGGFNVVTEQKKVRQMIGYMPDFFGVYDNLKTEEYLDFYGAAYNLSLTERKKTIPQMLELVNLANKKDSYVDSLSRGMKQRLCLARALIHDPEVLILDEPASGLDPRARVEMREILKELKHMDKTILISSHILPELSEMCDVIGIIDQGVLKAEGSVAAIRQTLQADRQISVTVHGDIETAIAFFEQHAKTTLVEVQNDVLSFGFKGADQEQAALLSEAIGHGIAVLSFRPSETNLEDVFMELTKEVELT